MKTIEQKTEAALAAVVSAAGAAVRRTIEVPDSVPVGTVVRQGDVLYVRVDVGWPHGEATGRQVVTGETLGSRHTAEAPAKCYVGKKAPEVRSASRGLVELEADAFLGAYVESAERFECPHPEHGHFSLPAGGWQVVQQMDERTRQRMAD